MIIRGARQVGKSTLVRQFAALHNMTLNEINLERHLYLDKIFHDLNMTTIRNELEAIIGRPLFTPNSLLFLDEIQACPSAIPALRYFYEDMPEIPIIAAGSLLEFVLSEHQFSMPVGRVVYHQLGPMSFYEFIDATAPSLCRYLDNLNFKDALPQGAVKQLLEHMRLFMFVGGMPEAVLAYKETGSIEGAVEIHRSIINTYEDDFAKYAQKKELSRLQGIFRQIPRTVGKKVKYVNISREDRAREVKDAITLLAKARVCYPVYASHCSGLPLYADINESAYKLLFLDVGLMNHVCGLDWLAYRRIDDVALINAGAIAEQFVGQHLATPSKGDEPPKPVYWLREGRRENAEVDYVLSNGPEIYPIEVKAGKSGTLRSLHQFILAKGASTAVRFDLNQPSRQEISHEVWLGKGKKRVTYELLSLPVYAIGELERLLTDLRKR